MAAVLLLFSGCSNKEKEKVQEPVKKEKVVEKVEKKRAREAGIPLLLSINRHWVYNRNGWKSGCCYGK